LEFKFVISNLDVEAVLNGDDRIVLDLGKGEEITVVRDDDAIFIDDIEFDIDTLKSMTRWKGVYGITDNGDIFKLEIRSGSYYKLVQERRYEAPTLEIDGIRMHRTKWTDPWTDAGVKVAKAGVGKGDHVLDVCTGLGYTALRAMEAGAHVTTIEIDENVIELARVNPWSDGLEGADLITGDAVEVVPTFDDESFNVVIHDPPRLARAGELYSTEFYSELFRVLKPGGTLVHYVGSPGSRYRGKDVPAGVAKRLTMVGFDVEEVDRKWGLIRARKPI